MQLAPHPRLYISPDHYARLQEPPATPLLERAAARVTSLARRFVRDPVFAMDETKHNWHLNRARGMQRRVVTLLVEYRRTGKRRYRDAVLADVGRMAEWEYWSWITWRQNDPRPEAIFDLSYGENAATLAIAFDGLRDELTDAEVSLFTDTARRRALQPFLQRTEEPSRPWWFGHRASNWNTVCAGGAGMLALAMGDLLEESAPVLERAEQSIAPFFEALGASGAWPEGIGYWNYGMRYGFMYLLSHERATGQSHRLMQRPGTSATLRFPLVFSPNGVPCSFGDVNSFAPLPFHLAAAERLGCPEVIAELDRRLAGEQATRFGSWPDEAELLLLHPRGSEQPGSSNGWERLSLQDGLDWGYVADEMPRPNLYVSVRGGTLDAPHVHQDLLSYHCLVGQERLIENVPVDDYIDTTFSPRRWELYETANVSKNTLFINGAGVADKSSVVTSVVRGDGYDGFRMDATGAMGTMRDGPAARFCARLILLVHRAAVLVIDRVEVPHAALVESRLHTFYPVTLGKLQARVRGRHNHLQLAFAATQPTLLKRGLGTPTHPPRRPDNMIRHVSSGKVMAITLCHVLLPNARAAAGATVEEVGDRSVVTVAGDVPFRLDCTLRLEDVRLTRDIAAVITRG